MAVNPMGTDTILAVATAPGFGAGHGEVAVLRFSGPAFAVIERGVVVWDGDAPAAGRVAKRASARCLLLRGGYGLVPCGVLRMPSPRSFTGEDTLELHLPANQTVVERITAEVLRSVPGTRWASPGEFAARAFLAGKMTVDQAEGLAATINATNEEQLSAAAELLRGTTGERYRSWADELATLLALVEAGIDFTDQEDVVAIAPQALARRTGELYRAVRRELGDAAGSDGGVGVPHDGLARVVLVGKPNAGKSTLFNALLRRNRAVASPVAGTTRDVLQEELDLARDCPGSGKVMLCDVAGLGGTNGPVDSFDVMGRAAAQEAMRSADALVWCSADGRFDEALIAGFAGPVIRVRTFADQMLNATGTGGAIAVCGLDGANLGLLRRAIADAVTGSRAGTIAGVLPRHRHALRRAAAALEVAVERAEAEARGAAHKGSAPEMVAGALREALDHLGELVGVISPDDVIGRVFSTFCVGK